MVPKDAWNALMGEFSQKIEEINRLLVMFRSEQMRSLPAPAPSAGEDEDPNQAGSYNP